MLFEIQMNHNEPVAFNNEKRLDMCSCYTVMWGRLDFSTARTYLLLLKLFQKNRVSPEADAKILWVMFTELSYLLCLSQGFYHCPILLENNGVNLLGHK